MEEKKKLRFIIIAFVLLLTLGVVGYIYLLDVEFIDALYMTVITISTVGFGEVGTSSNESEIFTVILIFLGVGVVGYAFTTIVAMFVEGKLVDIWKGSKMERKISSLSNHYIICGSGETAKVIIDKFVEEALDFVDSIKTKYSDATHNCSAYIIGEDKLIQRFDDDGEPSQTAGIPILEVIKKEDLTNVCVVVTRYYGGIKLGAGGLIRAYTKASSECLNESVIVDKKIFRNFQIEFDYTNVGSIENFLMNNDIYVADKQYSDKVVFDILLDEDKYQEVEGKLIDLTNDNIKFTMIEFTYQSSLNGKLIF